MNTCFKIYKLTFKNYEINIFDSYEREDRRKRLMSLYSFLLKNADFGAIKISFSSLLKRYNKGYKKYKMALTTLKDAIKTLIDLGLLKVIDKARNVNVYSFLRFNFSYFYGGNPTDIRPENPTCGKLGKPIKNTQFSQDDINSKYISVNKDIDLDNKDNALMEYPEFIDSQEKVNDLNTVINHAKKLFKFKKVTNKLVKEKVLEQLTKYYKNITIKFLDNYILKTIIKTMSDLKSIKTRVQQDKKAYKASKLTFVGNCESREYDYDKLESMLLGQKDGTLSECEIKKDKTENNSKKNISNTNKTSNLKFNNFDQRTYDYEELEKKLLGWE